MKKVLLRFYDKKNLGDDLFIKILTDRYQNRFSVILSEKNPFLSKIKNLITYQNKFLYLLFKGLEKLLGWRHIWLNNLAKQHDSLILVGGSIFIEKNNIALWEKEKNFYQQLPIPYYILGCNFGPYRDTAFPSLVTDIFKQAQDVCFRDQHSYALFSDLKATRLASDIVFTLETSGYTQASEKCVIFSVINCQSRFGLDLTQKYEHTIRQLTEKLLRLNYRVVYMSFCAYEGDEIAVARIRAALPPRQRAQVAVYHYDGDLEAALALLASCEILIATRLHASILGLVFGKKVLPIAYDAKIMNLLHDLSFPGAIIDLQQIDQFNVDAFDFSQLTVHCIDKQIELAERQFQELDKVLVRQRPLAS